MCGRAGSPTASDSRLGRQPAPTRRCVKTSPKGPRMCTHFSARPVCSGRWGVCFMLRISVRASRICVPRISDWVTRGFIVSRFPRPHWSITAGVRTFRYRPKLLDIQSPKMTGGIFREAVRDVDPAPAFSSSSLREHWHVSLPSFLTS